MEQPEVSIITVNFNGKKFLENLFNSAMKLNYRNFEIIFVDNASTDGSVEYVKKNYPKVKVIENQDNLGFAIANNNAARIAKGEYIFFLNNDTKVHPDVIFELVKKIKEVPRIGIAGCRLMSYDGKKHFHTGIGIDILGYPVVLKKVFYIEGSALMIKKELFAKLNGFDSQYFMFHEDIDLAWRARLLGYNVVAFPLAIVYHAVGVAAGGGEKKNGKYQTTFLRRYYSERNNIRTILKNYQFNTLLLILPLYFLINFTEIIFFLVTFKFKIIILYFKAYAWNFINFRNTLQERVRIQQTRTTSDKTIIKNMYLESGKFIALREVGIPIFKTTHLCNKS